MNTLTRVLFAALFALTLTACNTTSGVGQDIEAAGEKIEEVAEDVKDDLD